MGLDVIWMKKFCPCSLTLAIMYSFCSWVINTAVDITIIVFTAQSLHLQEETQVCGGGRVFLCLVLPQYSWFQKSRVWAASSREAWRAGALANGRISTGSEVNINTICSWETKASCQTLGPAASGTCFVIFTIGLAMFTLLKSFQIIKNRKTFKHYCFSALQCAGGGRKKRTLFQREQVECQGRGRQGDICCLVQTI